MAKLKVLGLHGFRTSGEILRRQTAKWDQRILERLDIHYLDGPFPAQGKSDVQDVYPPPYYEWFQPNQDHTKCFNFEECVSYVEDYMLQHGPFHGLLGFSQGSYVTAVLAGLQEKGLDFLRVPSISFVIIVSGSKFKPTNGTSKYLMSSAYSPPIKCLSLHFLGEKDFLRPNGEELLKSFVNPAVIKHPVGHTVPRLEEEGIQIFVSFLDRVEEEVRLKESKNEEEIKIEESKKNALMEDVLQKKQDQLTEEKVHEQNGLVP